MGFLGITFVGLSSGQHELDEVGLLDRRGWAEGVYGGALRLDVGYFCVGCFLV